MQKASRFKSDARHVCAFNICALGVAMGFYSATVVAQPLAPPAAVAAVPVPAGAPASASATAQPPSPAFLDSTFGQAVAEAKLNRERALKAEFEAKRQTDFSSLMPGISTAQNPFVSAQSGPAPGAAAPDAQGSAEPQVVGLTGAMGKYTAELWYEGTVYRVRSDQLPLRQRLWTVVQINEQGVVLKTKQKWTGVARDGSYRLSAPMPGAPEPTLGANPFGGQATAAAFQANSLSQRLPPFTFPDVK